MPSVKPGLERIRFEPVLRGVLLTGDAPVFARAGIGSEATGTDASTAPLWEVGAG
jgi:hypothetical protein